MLKTGGETGSPNEGMGLRHVNWDRPRRGELKICDQPGSPNVGASPNEGGVEGLSAGLALALGWRRGLAGAGACGIIIRFIVHGICLLCVRECVVALRQEAVQSSPSVWIDASTLPSRDPVDLVGAAPRQGSLRLNSRDRPPPLVHANVLIDILWLGQGLSKKPPRSRPPKELADSTVACVPIYLAVAGKKTGSKATAGRPRLDTPDT